MPCESIASAGELAKRPGFEPDASPSCQVSSRGQKVSSGGQQATKPGHPQGDTKAGAVELRTDSVLRLTHPGRWKSTISAQREHNISIIGDEMPLDLAEVAAAWGGSAKGNEGSNSADGKVGQSVWWDALSSLTRPGGVEPPALGFEVRFKGFRRLL